VNELENGKENGNDRWGVVLLGHGSQRGTSKAECSCAWLQSKTPSGESAGTPVWCQDCPSTPDGLKQAANRLQGMLELDQSQMVLSCLEFLEPFPPEAVKMLDDRGIHNVVLAPFLLGNGKHATLEMEEIIEEVRGQLPGIQLHLAGGLGLDPNLADLVVQRVRELEAGDSTVLGQGTGPKGILLVKAGTKTEYDDCIWLEELGQLIEGKLGADYAVAVAQSHYGDPTMDAAAAELAETRNVSSIMCVPYLFFPGIILQRNVIGGMELIKERYPDVVMSVTPPLGIDDKIVAITANRVRQVWSQAAS
jgi:sirohydrochlorin ferrochelatase|tara:strand:+ start:12356 stop:13276 length:921 start_codon:yes stop_codon:yes gene_type:complete